MIKLISRKKDRWSRVDTRNDLKYHNYRLATWVSHVRTERQSLPGTPNTKVDHRLHRDSSTGRRQHLLLYTPWHRWIHSLWQIRTPGPRRRSLWLVGDSRCSRGDTGSSIWGSRQQIGRGWHTSGVPISHSFRPFQGRVSPDNSTVPEVFQLLVSRTPHNSPYENIVTYYFPIFSPCGFGSTSHSGSLHCKLTPGLPSFSTDPFLLLLSVESSFLVVHSVESPRSLRP